MALLEVKEPVTCAPPTAVPTATSPASSVQTSSSDDVESEPDGEKVEVDQLYSLFT